MHQVTGTARARETRGGVGKEDLTSAGVDVNWFSSCGRLSGALRTLEMDLSCAQQPLCWIFLLGFYLKKAGTPVQRGLCTPMSTATPCGTVKHRSSPDAQRQVSGSHAQWKTAQP